MQNESGILAQIRNTLGRLSDVRLFRNNSGVFKDAAGHVVRYGIPSTGGGSDLVGWRSITITQDMVGRKFAIFLAIEVKTATGKPTDKQLNFIRAVNEAGGVAGIVRSVEQAEALCQQFQQPVKQPRG